MKMLKSLVAASALALLAVTSFGGTAQAAQAKVWSCSGPIMKGGCATLIYLPDQPLPKL